MAEFTIRKEEDAVSYVEVVLNNETVKTEAGAMRYTMGDIKMTSKMPGVKGFFKAKATGEAVFKPEYTGTGKLVLEPSFMEYYSLQLEDNAYVLDRGAYWASDGSIEITAKRNKAIAGLFSGEGLFQTLVRGTGCVIISAPGRIEEIELQGQKLVVDGSFAVARSESLTFSVQKSTKSLLASVTSGEGFVNVIEGMGKVLLAPVPNRNVLLQSLMLGVSASKSR